MIAVIWGMQSKGRVTIVYADQYYFPTQRRRSETSH